MPLPALLLSAAGLVAGGVAVGAVGFGAVLVAAPVLAVTAPEVLPFVFVVPTIATDGWVAWRERAALDRGFVLRASLLQIPGAVVGALVLRSLDDPRRLGLVVGLLVLVMVVARALPWRPARSRRSEAIAATLAGVSGAVSGMNGPPVAALLADERPAVVRATLPTFFVVSQAVLVASWAGTGVLDGSALALGAVAAPAMLAGGVIGQALAGRISAATVRRTVLGLALVAVTANLWSSLA